VSSVRSTSKKIFLSIVTNEFASYRELLTADLKRPNRDVAVQEDFIVSGGTTLSKLDTYIKEHCDCVVHVIGKATGSIPPAVAAWLVDHGDFAKRFPLLADALGGPHSDFSYTQWEAYFALYYKRPLLVYRPSDFELDTLLVPRDPHFIFNADEARSQKAHYQRICAIGHDRGQFDDKERLSSTVLNDLTDILNSGLKIAIRISLIFLVTGILAIGVGFSIHTARTNVRLEQEIHEHDARIEADQRRMANVLDAIDKMQFAIVISQGKVVNSAIIPQAISPTVTSGAESLAQQNIAEGLAAVKIINQQYAEADQIIQAKLAEAGLSETERFNLLTLDGDNWFRAGDPDRAIAPYEAALKIRPTDLAALRNAIAANDQSKTDDPASIAKNRKSAINFSSQLLGQIPRNTLTWAMASYHMGTMLYGCPVVNDAAGVERKKNLHAAIEALEASLAVPAFKSENPNEWGNAQDFLGAAWNTLDSEGDPPTYQHELTEAIKAYRQSATIYTKEAYPDRWVADQVHIGGALHDLPTNHSQNIVEAIAVLKDALKVKHAHDFIWAYGYNVLGKCQGDLAEVPGQDKRACYADAIASKKATLQGFSPTSNSFEYDRSIRRLREYRTAYEATGAATTRPYDSILPAN
jgi:tetratricopeptide (TPR) repeat protein